MAGLALQRCRHLDASLQVRGLREELRMYPRTTPDVLPVCRVSKGSVEATIDATARNLTYTIDLHVDCRKGVHHSLLQARLTLSFARAQDPLSISIYVMQEATLHSLSQWASLLYKRARLFRGVDYALGEHMKTRKFVGERGEDSWRMLILPPAAPLVITYEDEGMWVVEADVGMMMDGLRYLGERLDCCGIYYDDFLTIRE